MSDGPAAGTAGSVAAERERRPGYQASVTASRTWIGTSQGRTYRAFWEHGLMSSVIRALTLGDVQALTALYRENREFLAPWQPLRPESYFTDAGQRVAVEGLLAQQASGIAVPLVIVNGIGSVVGTFTVASIIRGAFQSCSVGYWLAEGAQGQGLATAALREAADLAFGDLRLHRIQAETLTHNERSQRVL